MSLLSRFLVAATPLLLLVTTPAAGIEKSGDAGVDAAALARSVTIYRDAWGVPHIYGPTDASVVFGFAYAQAEDYFWQVEDNYILALGRYAELHGEKELHRDLRNRVFEIPARSRADYPTLDPRGRAIAEAFTAGLNYYLQKHPETRPRLIHHFEPWHVLAYARAMVLELCYRYTRLPGSVRDKIWARRGSNAWAIAPSRTRAGHAMLLINPHQPWYGVGQFYEVHLSSDEGWNFSGATFFGSPLPSLGHNEHAGWAFTVNEPDVADVWRETFDDPSQPLRYRHGRGHRSAVEWKDTIRVRVGDRIEPREYTFRKTHHGPVVARESDTRFLAARIAGLYEGFGAEQTLALLRVKNLADFKAAMALGQIPIFNAVYADRHGDIYYLYNGVVPRRDRRFDWTRPVDGSDPRTEWKEPHPLEELPQLENPPCGFLQNCNSTPFLTSDDGNPHRGDFPRYMLEDGDDDRRRARMSRRLLRRVRDITLEEFQKLAFDTTLQWPLAELPRLAHAFRQLEKDHPALAGEARPYFQHLLDWDCRVEPESTQATLCVEWYRELYGNSYPAETLRQTYIEKPHLKFEALVKAANQLRVFHQDWKVPYGDIHRLQRHSRVTDFRKIPFSDRLPGLPCVGAPGPLGTIFTVYYLPSIYIPFVRETRKQYAIVGTSYLSVIEFGERIRGGSLLQFGQSGDPDSPHFFDQARLFSERRLKPRLFYRDEVVAGAKRIYHPGDENGPPETR